MTGGRLVRVEGWCWMMISLMEERRNDRREACAGGGVVLDDDKFDEGAEK